MAYGVTTFRGGHRKLMDDVDHALMSARSPFIVSTDFTKYDTSIPPWLINRVYWILSQYLDFGAYSYGTTDSSSMIDLYWKLADQCINTRFVMPDGQMYEKDGGVDSGSYDFQLIECICTWIMLQYAFKKMNVDTHFIYTLGDDSFTLTNSSYPIDFKMLANIINAVFGVVVNTEKSLQSYKIEEIKFLGRYCHNGYPYRDLLDVILAALYPHRDDETDEDIAQRILALYYDNAAGNPHAERFLQLVWEDLDIGEVSLRPHVQKKFILWGIRPPDVTDRLPGKMDLVMLVTYPMYKDVFL